MAYLGLQVQQPRARAPQQALDPIVIYHWKILLTHGCDGHQGIRRMGSMQAGGGLPPLRRAALLPAPRCLRCPENPPYEVMPQPLPRCCRPAAHTAAE